jgi:UDP-2,3-diacylglucosamine pyrophosphatase LpxH
MKAIVISDLHIGSPYFQFGIFERFIEKLPIDYELIMNGDIVDSPYAKMEVSDRKVLDLLKEISCRQKVVWLRGNHDNGYVPKNFGNTIFTSSYSIGKRLLITHGDDFDDIMPRSRLFIRVFKLMHNLRIRMGARPIHVAEYAKKWKALYRVLRKNVAMNAVKCAAENGFEAVTCGHTHFPEDLTLDGIRYINTGAWTEEPAYYLNVTADEMKLVQVDGAFVAHHGVSAPLEEFESAIPFTDSAYPAIKAGQDYRGFAP